MVFGRNLRRCRAWQASRCHDQHPSTLGNKNGKTGGQAPGASGAVVHSLAKCSEPHIIRAIHLGQGYGMNCPHVWSKGLIRALLGVLLICASGVHAQALNRPIQAGREYVRLDPSHPVASGSRIEVLEFFYYGCPICYELQPHLSRWLHQAPPYVMLRRVPVLSIENWEPFARLFHTLNLLGEVNRLHWPVYDNFHFDGIKLNDEKTMLDWVSRNGIDRQKFLTAYNSEEVLKLLAQSRTLLKQYQITGVPSIVIDGKYLTSARLAGGTRQLAQVIDDLVKLARKERPE